MEYQGDGSEFWQDGYFVQQNVDASKLADNIIKAKVDGEWQEYELTEFPEIFFNWDFDKNVQN